MIVSALEPAFAGAVMGRAQIVGKFCLANWLLVSGLLVCGGCWSETDAPAPLPLPVTDPQIVDRPAPPLAAGDFAAVRKFRFFYEVTVSDLKPGEKARIWIPVASSGSQQRVKRELTNVPGEVKETQEAKYGNSLLYTEATANEQGEIPLLMTYLVERVEALPGTGESASETMSKAALDESLVWTGIDPQMTEAMKRNKVASSLPVAEQVRANYDKLLKASNSNPAAEASLLIPFVVLCRRDHIPADVEWGFEISKQMKGKDLQPTGWAKFVADGRWQMVDLAAAQANPQAADYAFGTLSPDRLHFSTGCYLKLQPAPTEGAVVQNLVLPYVEVEGKRYEKLKTNIRYEDVTGKME